MNQSSSIYRFLGGPPLAVFLRLVVMSFVLGVILSALGISPYDIVAWFQHAVFNVFDLGFGTLDRIWQYFLLGAVIVVPLWLISRVLRAGRRGDDVY